MTRPALLIVGGEARDAGADPAVVALARRTRTGVLNTWRAKGLFRFDDPAHLGTIGLQRDDLVLAGVAGERRAFGRIVVCGVADGELPAGLAGGLPPDAEVVSPGDLDELDLVAADRWPDRPPLYDALAAVCGPAYRSPEVPLSPIRAAGDLAAWLPDGATVVAGAGAPGFWLARTFPTRAPDTVQLPSRADPGFVAGVVDQSDTGVVVVCGPDDDVPDVRRRRSPQVHEDGERRPAAGGWMVVERWLPDGPARAPGERVEQLAAAVAAGGGVVEVGVATGALGLVEDVAGPVVVWGGPSVGWRA